jgi:uncharacterized membrane protein YeaQ/YmgE (transglycosylase-associated protein family)
MNIAIWMLAGGMLGWLSFTYMAFNEARGMVVSAVIGAAGGLIGGKMLAPMFTDPAPVPADFSVSALFFAAAVAAVFLFAGHQIEERWGV